MSDFNGIFRPDTGPAHFLSDSVRTARCSRGCRCRLEGRCGLATRRSRRRFRPLEVAEEVGLRVQDQHVGAVGKRGAIGFQTAIEAGELGVATEGLGVEAAGLGITGAPLVLGVTIGLGNQHLALAVGIIGPVATGGDPLRQWPYKLLLALGGALGILLGAYCRTWRLTADAGGLRLRRLVLPSLDVPWEELDALVTSNDGQTLYVMAGGRRRAGFSVVCVSHGDALSALYGAARSHGALVSAERDLPEGVPGPHGARRGDLRDWIGGLPAWRATLLVLAACTAFSLAMYLLLVLFMR